MKKTIFIAGLLIASVCQADIVYTIDLYKALKPIKERLDAIEQKGVPSGTNSVDLVTVTNCVKGIVNKEYVESLNISIPVPAISTNTVVQVVTADYVNDLGFSLRPLNPVTNLVEVTEAHEVGDLVETVNTLVLAIKQLQEQWQSHQKDSATP